MNSLHSLTKVLATATLIVLGSSLSVAASQTRDTVSDPITPDVSQALLRLTSANDQRVTKSIDDSVATMAAKADDTVVTLSRPLDRNTRSRFARNLRFVRATRG